MLEKDPTTWGLATWALGMGMAVGGGLVNWYTKFKYGNTRAFSIFQFIGEIVISAVVGIGTFMGLAALGCPLGLCAAMAGVGGHMGTRLLFLWERYVEKYFEKKIKDLDL